MSANASTKGSDDRQNVLGLHQRVLARLHHHDITGAQQLAQQAMQIDNQVFIWRDIAITQVQTGDLLGAEASAQLIPYADVKGEATRNIIQVYLQKGDTKAAQRLVTMIPYTPSWPIAMQAIAKAQAQAGDIEAAHHTLHTAQQHLQAWSEGDHWNGYPRASYLVELVEAQLALGDVEGARQTAHTITIPDYRVRALEAVKQVE